MTREPRRTLAVCANGRVAHGPGIPLPACLAAGTIACYLRFFRDAGRPVQFVGNKMILDINRVRQMTSKKKLVTPRVPRQQGQKEAT